MADRRKASATTACLGAVHKDKGIAMSEKFETRGEIGHSLAGLRDQLAFQSKVLGAAVIMAVVALGLLFNQYSGISLKFADLMASNSRNEAKLASMETLVSEMEDQIKQARAETAAAKRAVDNALEPTAPRSAAFPGWIGVQAQSSKEAKSIVDQYKSSVWIFATAPKE